MKLTAPLFQNSRGLRHSRTLMHGVVMTGWLQVLGCGGPPSLSNRGKLPDFSGKLGGIVKNTGRCPNTRHSRPEKLGFLVKMSGILPKYRGRRLNDRGRLAKYLPEMANNQGILAIYRGRFINDLPEISGDLPEIVNAPGRPREYRGRLPDDLSRRAKQPGRSPVSEPRMGSTADQSGRTPSIYPCPPELLRG